MDPRTMDPLREVVKAIRQDQTNRASLDAGVAMAESGNHQHPWPALHQPRGSSALHRAGRRRAIGPPASPASAAAPGSQKCFPSSGERKAKAGNCKSTRQGPSSRDALRQGGFVGAKFLETLRVIGASGCGGSGRSVAGECPGVSPGGQGVAIWPGEGFADRD